ncbi:MAG TPA: hypothetical protein VFN67_31105 [Polyangiales bacterium]|nr:hypothetical protein [Polyangiales bacterium]
MLFSGEIPVGAGAGAEGRAAWFWTAGAPATEPDDLPPMPLLTGIALVALRGVAGDFSAAAPAVLPALGPVGASAA